MVFFEIERFIGFFRKVSKENLISNIEIVIFCKIACRSATFFKKKFREKKFKKNYSNNR